MNEVLDVIEINRWMQCFLETLNRIFGERVWFVGLQGSYGRGEATEASDIDVVVILDELSASDIYAYNRMLDNLEHRELICGFLSGKQELLHWDPSDLFQFYHDTKPIKGTLDALLPLLDGESVERAIRIGLCNLYHGCVHNMLYEKNEEVLRGLYKSASFVIQAIFFRETGSYVSRQDDLIRVVSVDEQSIIRNFLHLKSGNEVDFDGLSERLFSWVKQQFDKYESAQD